MRRIILDADMVHYNIFAERVIGILINEYCLDAFFTNHNQACLVVKEAIHYYNTDRPHLSLNMAVPKDVYFGIYHDVSSLMIPESDSPNTYYFL